MKSDGGTAVEGNPERETRDGGVSCHGNSNWENQIRQDFFHIFFKN
jgi:hypothetical protein